MANAFYNAAAFLKDENFKIESIALIENSKNISFEDSRVRDFGICHGSVGIVIQYHQLGLKNNLDCNNEIEKWFKNIENQTKNFENFMAHKGNNEYETDMSLLTGATGLGMVLLTLNNKIDLDWLDAFNLH